MWVAKKEKNLHAYVWKSTHSSSWFFQKDQLKQKQTNINNNNHEMEKQISFATDYKVMCFN